MTDKTGEAIKERVKTDKKEPALYKVVLLNDDYTTMEFVVQVLEREVRVPPGDGLAVRNRQDDFKGSREHRCFQL